MSETKMFIAFMSSYLCGNCRQDVRFLLLAGFLFLNKRLKPRRFFVWLREGEGEIQKKPANGFYKFLFFPCHGTAFN